MVKTGQPFSFGCEFSGLNWQAFRFGEQVFRLKPASFLFWLASFLA
jgi:hypothetical protein